MTLEEAEGFVAELADLCAEHGVMLWSAVETTPIMLSPVEPDDLAHISYVAVRSHPAIETFYIRRVIGGPA